MAKNRLLLPATADDIDARVERVLKGLGYPEPPLRLEQVRELLKLDRAFYTANDPGLIREALSRVRVAGKQIVLRPGLIFDAIAKFSLKAFFLPDRKRIYLDKDEPEKKHRWNEAHEIGHSLVPWHDDSMHGDNAQTLSQGCTEQIEAEANFAAGRLLFLRDRFRDEAHARELCFASVQQLKAPFGNTYTTTFYRYIETAGGERPLVGLITCHPHRSRRPETFDPTRPCRHFIQSPSFGLRFSKIDEVSLFRQVAAYCGAQSGGMLGREELILRDDNGDDHRFVFETFFNRFDALTLGVHVRQEPRTVSLAVPF